MKKFQFALMCVAMVAFIACKPTNEPEKPNGGDPGTEQPGGDEKPGGDEPAEYVCPIDVTDNTADDWANVPEGYLFETKNAEGAVEPALKSVKVFADDIYLNLLVEWDTELVTDLTSVPFHVYLNVDGDAETGGYGDQWLEPYNIDILMEGFFYSEGEACAYEPGMFGYGGAYGTNEWNWAELTAAGAFSFSQHLGDNKMEIQMLHELIPAEWGETLTIGFDIQQNWNSVGVLPNAPADEVGAKVKADKLTVKFYKPE